MRLARQPRSTYKVTFHGAVRSPREPVGRVPRVARMLALAHKIDGMISRGQLEDLAHAARSFKLTRARVTQITNLLLLAPEIQTEILDLPNITHGRDPVSERQLRRVVAEVDWNRQLARWREIHG